MRRIVLLPILVLGLAAVGCSDDDDTNTNQNNNNVAPPPELRVATYNGGLARGFVDYADLRAPLVSDAVANLEADVICVQEFWQPEHVTMLSTDATDVLPNQIFLEPMPDLNPGDPACDASELAPLATCAQDHCAGVPADQIADCILGQCGAQYLALSGTCQACLGAHIGEEFDAVITACTTGSEAYAYGGSFGIGLLTNQTIADQDHIVMDSSLNRRGVIYAQLETTDFGTVHVFCTHLTAVFSDIPYPQPTGTWAEEQAAQIDTMRAWIDEKAGAGGQVILLGDFNTGPAGTGYVAEVVDNYNALVDGFTSVYAGMTDATCTFCDTNTLNGGIDHDSSVLIDHVFLRGMSVDASAERIFTELVQITPDATPVDTNLSDHYGVRALLTLPAE